ncbi:hypothetical protein ACFQ1S_03175 [Kibdelosporangium lantanae]|uniref:Phytanoyl-CoA dioxygenase n=1 Tax=Kibdelosporangium lantanae TaxID=1497396 RepID=A0ABW3M213_9PSEU
MAEQGLLGGIGWTRAVRVDGLTGPAGTCWLFNSHLWHSGTVNNSTEPRHAVLTSFHRRHSGPTLGGESLPSHETVLRLGNAAYLLL